MLTEEQIDNANKRKVLVELYKMKASFLSELAWQTGLSEYDVKIALNELNTEGDVEQIVVLMNPQDPRLLLRVPDQSARGQAGFSKFSQKRWFGLTEKGEKYAKRLYDVFRNENDMPFTF